MKSDTERKKFHTEKLHKKRSRMHIHLSKGLRSKLKAKKRAVLVRKGDTVKVMRGPGKGKEAKVASVNVLRRKVFVEGVVAKSARGREVGLALEPSNLLLTSLEATKERRRIFSEEAFRKPDAPKKEAHAAPSEKAEAPKAKAEEHKHKAHEAAKPHEGKQPDAHEHNAEHKAPQAPPKAEHAAKGAESK
jgi:ribosomal protein uL24